MFQEIVRETIRKILNDKILFGLLIVCLLGVFVGGFNYKQDQQRSKDTDNTENVRNNAQPVVNSAPSKVDDYSRNGKLTPDLAVQFVKWWIKPAMDYTPASAASSHQAASNWMTPGAAKCFDQAFWNPTLAQQITTGAAAGAFQPIAVQARALNPDGTVVVAVAGTLVLEMGSRPSTHQIEMDVLVQKGSTGLRIIGLYNRLTSVSSSVY